MSGSNGRRVLDGVVISIVLGGFVWFMQQAPPSAAVVAAIVIAAGVLAIWVPNRHASTARLSRVVLFAGAILGFVAGSQALRVAGESSSGIPLALAGIALLAFGVAMLRMIGWRGHNGSSAGTANPRGNPFTA